ncbi:hypothetical protein CDL15_Pgr025985 [Punica granatum]|uniref:Uncharacterized protein n=1 Tax=Punica granatum TaxID=22663 RepID=A0A218WBG1_PUNGR|nr:hypothetical protein CDL15_Pgr025985 [Punica granatum]
MQDRGSIWGRSSKVRPKPAAVNAGPEPDAGPKPDARPKPDVGPEPNAVNACSIRKYKRCKSKGWHDSPVMWGELDPFFDRQRDRVRSFMAGGLGHAMFVGAVACDLSWRDGRS